ncbi:hypothetical protein Q4595_17860, partial [Wenyingzhuangia sp. 1_MG-2023]|nr:hypothetical protein [Wenyingzhuangia sp. 1_MG-2023]
TVPWTATAETDLDTIRLELASALGARLPNVQQQKLTGLVTHYPQSGNAQAVVSAELTLTYTETITAL